jgi:hypothetical protein
VRAPDLQGNDAADGAVVPARRGTRIEELAERIAVEATVRATLDSLARGERARADRDPYDHQPASPWRHTAEEPERATCGTEQLVAFHALPEAEQAKFWTALRALVELRERAARSRVVAEAPA